MVARKAYGLAIYEKEDQIEKIDDAHYLYRRIKVRDHSSGKPGIGHLI